MITRTDSKNLACSFLFDFYTDYVTNDENRIKNKLSKS